MTSVIVALVSALGGVLAGLLPVFLTSARKRRVQYMRDEVELIAAVDDDGTREHLRRGLRATAKLHADEAEMTPRERVRSNLVSIGPAMAYYALVGVVIVGLAEDKPDNVISAEAARAIGFGMTGLSLVVLLPLAVAYVRAVVFEGTRRRE